MSDLDKLIEHIEVAQQGLEWADKRIQELEALTKWQPIKTIPEGKASGNAVLIFNPLLRDDPDFPGHPIVISNPAYAWMNAAKDGYTYWMPLPPPPAD